jgi:hypothetical protein
MSNLILSLAIIAILLFILQKIPQTKLLGRPINLLTNGFIHARLDLPVRFLAHSACISIPLTLIGLLHIIEMLMYTLSFVTMAILITPELAINSNSELVITKKVFNKGVEVHLRNPYQNFTMRTYKELESLVEYFPNIGVKRIKLSSPMFYHSNGALRDFSTLERLLTKKSAILSNYESKPWQNILGKISMMIDRHKEKKEKIKKINLNKWRVLIIDIERYKFQK